jgi:leukotriene-A4 hydrolase
MATLDPHSHADLTQGQIRELELDLKVDFANKTLGGEAVLQLAQESAGGPLDLDTRALRIESVTDQHGKPLDFALHPPEAKVAEWMGERLRVQLPRGTTAVHIRYRTAPDASALQWLGPEQTAGGKLPYLFSQCQAIHARSVVPLQDTPRCRVTARARFHVPSELRALMAAGPLGRTPSPHAGMSCDSFHLPQPVPPYLLAFAVGDLAERKLTPRISVWSEPAVVDAAAWEFAEVGKMMDAAEALFGPYDWERYDVLVMPPSFPYGGMENPRLTFLTPSVLAGDRSLVNVVAHELAHAWTGNLVTNADANHFWLNEGFTVYAERRILEALEGRATSELHAAIGRQDLEESLRRFEKTPELTRLRNDLSGVDPDAAYSVVPYEKGYLFLRSLEEKAGRAAFDAMLRAWLSAHRFQSVTTDDFVGTLAKELPGLGVRDAAGKLAPWAHEWIDGVGLPKDAPRPSSPRLLELRKLAEAAGRGELPPKGLAANELLLFLQALPATITAAQCAALDAHLGLRGRKSLELRCAFLVAALKAGVPDAPVQAREVLRETGRMKFLRPLYGALAARPETKPLAGQYFAETRARYHPIAQGVIEGLLKG